MIGIRRETRTCLPQLLGTILSMAMCWSFTVYRFHYASMIKFFNIIDPAQNKRREWCNMVLLECIIV